MKTPKKPHPEFPLTPCPNGQWRKIVNKKPYYFGSWRDDPRGERAVKDWLARKDGIFAGLELVEHLHNPSATSPDDWTIRRVFREYLNLRSQDVENNRLAPDSFRDYVQELTKAEAFFGSDTLAKGLLPPNFTAYRLKLDDRKLGPHAIKRVLACVKAPFNFAMEEGWITPILFGKSFKAPATDDDAIAQHKLRTKQSNRTEIVLTRKKVRKLLRAVKQDPIWYAFVLLMLNTASNPAELARIKWAEIDFKTGHMRRRRWKKGIRHEAYLWKRTRKALAAIPRKGEYIFVREDGRLWVDSQARYTDQEGRRVATQPKRWNFITRDFLPIAIGAKLPDVTPYTIRRTARTLALHCRDDNAAKRMMGQRLSGQDKTYAKRWFPRWRIRRISMTVYKRLFKIENKVANHK